MSEPGNLSLHGYALLHFLVITVAPLVAGAIVFFAVAYLDGRRQQQSLRSHLFRASPLYLLCLVLSVLMARGWSQPGFWEFAAIYVIPFEFFLGGIVGDASYCVLTRPRNRHA